MKTREQINAYYAQQIRDLFVQYKLIPADFQGNACLLCATIYTTNHECNA